MFTLKFYEEGNWMILSAPRYSVLYRCEKNEAKQDKEMGALVVVYPTFGNEPGVEYQVGMDNRGYSTLFIENGQGKTIDRIGPFDLPAESVAA